MPNVIIGSGSSNSLDISVDYGYKYPNGLNLRPDSHLCQQIVSKLLKRVRVSYDKMAPRRDSWREVDKTLTAYIPITEAERLVKEKDSRMPTSIVFPHSYSILETLTAFMDGLFLKTPIFRYTGNSPEDTVAAILLEKVIDIHCKRFKAGLALHTAFKDGIAYGLGACFPIWKQKWGWRTRSQMSKIGEIEKISEPSLLFEGNALENVDPYQLLLDPNYGVQAIQDSEFVGFVRRTNYYNLIEEDGKGSIFNVKYLKNGIQTSQFWGSKRDTSTQTTEVGDNTVLKPIDVIYLYIKIIPKDWGLSKSDVPEKWLFAIGGDRILIQAQPLDLDHEMFPIAVCAPTFDGYSSAPLGRLELLGGMQSLLDWLFNSHIANVRKTINDMIIYDPYMLNTADLVDPKPGKLVRARRAAWGKDIRGAITQLQVNDVTRQHISDAQLTMALMNQISGSDDTMMGTLRSGGPERLSAAEFQGTQSQALGRLQSLAMIVGQQLIQDLGYMMAMHTQQLMQDDVWVSTVGEWEQQLISVYGDKIRNQRMRVSPLDLNIDFDVSINSEDDSNNASAQFWVQMFDIVAKTPELYQLIDVPRVFRHIATQLGAKNVDNFFRAPIQPIGMATEQVMNEVATGSMVPIQEVANALAGQGGGMVQ